MLALAEAAGVSSYHFLQSFRKQTGCTPHHYVLLRRLERAKQLLADTPLSIADVAYAAGFVSTAHMAAVFELETASTPAAYRQNTRN